jgi:hypothetical protein
MHPKKTKKPTRSQTNAKKAVDKTRTMRKQISDDMTRAKQKREKSDGY